MSSYKRKMQRQQQKSKGELPYKKVIARKLGCSVSELNERMQRKEKNLTENGGNEDGE